MAVGRIDFQQTVKRNSVSLLHRKRMIRRLQLDERALPQLLRNNMVFQFEGVRIAD